MLEGGYRINGGIVSAFGRSGAGHVRALVDGCESRQVLARSLSSLTLLCAAATYRFFVLVWLFGLAFGSVFGFRFGSDLAFDFFVVFFVVLG